MHCPECGEPISSYHKFCYNCGHKIQFTLDDLRRSQRHELRALKRKLKRFDIAHCDSLIDICWAESAKKFYPNEMTYKVGDNVPESAFKEVKDTAAHAEILFKMIVPAICSFKVIHAEK